MENTCKNCGNRFQGKFCNRCGEKVTKEHDRSFMHLLEEAFHFITHFEGKFFNTLKVVFSRPGKLSSDYCTGIRKKYFKPISFFLMLVILYLLFPFFEGLNMKLQFHQNHFIYGDYATIKSQQLAEARGWSKEYLEESYLRKGEKTSKFLLFILLPAMALFSYLLGFKKRKFYYDHFIFSTEVISFYILWGYLIVPVLLLSLMKLGLFSMESEVLTGLIIISLFLVYLMLAARRFFNFRWWFVIIYSFLFILFLQIFIEWVYKFLLFFISIHLL
jgi:hypothetical protein